LTPRPPDIVVSGTAIDLAALVRLAKPVVRARYEMAEAAISTTMYHSMRSACRVSIRAV
jgi:predicted GTPase